MKTKEKLPTALNFYLKSSSDFYSVMDQYKDIHTSDLQKQLEEKDREIEVLRSNIIWITNDKTKILHTNSQYIIDNERLREALEGLHNYTKNHKDLVGYIKFNYLSNKAKEALKNKSDE